ncbi:H-type lectin domain-containing protein [Paenibacillus alvei]|uniref:H-type lectin domain-containing protein n=1 Tax=Paenibacillus alvei TaxID=44250 RepID=UPI00227F926E|nr:H-type lectin domain-containing protein [Paenibacillus alvei]MCY9737457.1 H-type lectin domain-containing protein [Paenibacillus alvei]
MTSLRLLDTADLIDKELKDIGLQEAEIRSGLSVINVEKTTQIKPEFEGRTLINLLGNEGDFINGYKDENGNKVPNSRWYHHRSVNQDTGKCEYIGNGTVKLSNSTDGNSNRLAMIVPRPLHRAGNCHLLMAEVNSDRVGNTRLEGAWAWDGINYASNKKVSEWETIYLPIYYKEDIPDTQSQWWVLNMNINTGSAYVRNARAYEITKEIYDKIVAYEEGWYGDDLVRKYPYVDNMKNVMNPYLVNTSGNLLPPFAEWGLHKNDTIIDSYKLEKIATAQYTSTISPKIRAIRGQTYTLSCERIGRMVLGEYKEDGTVIGYPIAEDKDNKGFFTQSVTIGTDTDYIIVQLSNMATSGTFSFENILLTMTSEQQTFTPIKRSIWAAECKLSSSPIDGSNCDILTIGNDGLPKVHEKWSKVTLDGSLPWEFVDLQIGFKRVKFPIKGNIEAVIAGSGFVIKYDGTYVPQAPTGNWADVHAVSADGSVYVSVPNTDSGWGQDYKPSRDEIKAYFMGWRMCQEETAGLFNGTGTRCWGRITDPANIIGVGGWNAMRELPTYSAGVDAKGNIYSPYRLQYLKGKPTVEPVKNYEIGLTLSEGFNQVDAGSGVVIREKANPFLYDAYKVWQINSSAFVNSKLMYPPKEIFGIYEESSLDSHWIIENHYVGTEWGNKYASKVSDKYNKSKSYYVSYIMTTQFPTLQGKLKYNTTIKSIIKNLNENVSNLELQQSNYTNQFNNTILKGNGEYVETGFTVFNHTDNSKVLFTQVNFKRTFKVPPIVVATVSNSNVIRSSNINVAATFITTTGFKLEIEFTADPTMMSTTNVGWVAFGS